jgi:hypothetical protein
MATSPPNNPPCVTIDSNILNRSEVVTVPPAQRMEFSLRWRRSLQQPAQRKSSPSMRSWPNRRGGTHRLFRCASSRRSRLVPRHPRSLQHRFLRLLQRRSLALLERGAIEAKHRIRGVRGVSIGRRRLVVPLGRRRRARLVRTAFCNACPCSLPQRPSRWPVARLGV